jgi:hypothetical protein
MPNSPEAVMIWRLVKSLLIFPKGLLGGLIAAILMWMVVVFYYNWHATRSVSGCVALGCVWFGILCSGLVGSSASLAPRPTSSREPAPRTQVRGISKDTQRLLTP